MQEIWTLHLKDEIQLQWSSMSEKIELCLVHILWCHTTHTHMLMCQFLLLYYINSNKNKNKKEKNKIKENDCNFRRPSHCLPLPPPPLLWSSSDLPDWIKEKTCFFHRTIRNITYSQQLSKLLKHISHISDLLPHRRRQKNHAASDLTSSWTFKSVDTMRTQHIFAPPHCRCLKRLVRKRQKR